MHHPRTRASHSCSGAGDVRLCCIEAPSVWQMNSPESSDVETVEIENDEVPFDDPLAMVLCPTTCCQDTLVFTASATSVECRQCGRRFTSLDFDDVNIEPIVMPSQFNYLIQRRRVNEKKEQAGGFPRMVHESIDGLHGRCHEKLLEPLFLHYGWEPSDETIRMIENGGKSPLWTFRACTFAIIEHHTSVVGYGRDLKATEYLAELLESIARENGSDTSVLVPLVTHNQAGRPGGCLFDVVSRFIIGRQIFSQLLREAMTNELQTNGCKYRKQLGDFITDEDWKNIMRENEHGSTDGLGNIYIFALANALERPIILFDHALTKESSSANTFLPLIRCKKQEKEEEGCCGSMKALPILIAWANPGHTHFVPLAGIQRSVAKYSDIRLARISIPPVWGVKDKDQGRNAMKDHLQFEGEQCVLMRRHVWFSASDLRPIVEGYNMADTRAFPVNLGLFADYIEDLPKNAMVEYQNLAHACRKACIQQRLLRCQECGKVTTAAADLKEVDDTNRLCGHCFTLGNRQMRADGTVSYINGDHTNTAAPRSLCRQKKKHFWDEKEYDNPPSRLNVSIRIGDSEVKVPVYWFSDETDSTRNSSTEEEAKRLVGKHKSTSSLSEVADQIRNALESKRQEAATVCPPDLSGQNTDLGIEVDDYPPRYNKFIKWSELRVDACSIITITGVQEIGKMYYGDPEAPEKAVAELESTIGDQSADKYWPAVCSLPKLFKRGGIFFEYANRHEMLQEGRTFSLPKLDGKEFVYKNGAIQWRVPELNRSFMIGPLTRSFVQGLLRRQKPN